MKLPKLEKPDKYVGLYVFDFGDHCSVGLTAEEVAELFESEKHKNCKAYKIHKAYPDGRIELKGVPAETFRLEAGMFFYSGNLETAKRDFKALVDLAAETAPPCRAKLHLAEYKDGKLATAVIYPAEYDDEISSWLLDGRFKTTGAAEAGPRAVQRYYNHQPKILDRRQFGKQKSEVETRKLKIVS